MGGLCAWAPVCRQSSVIVRRIVQTTIALAVMAAAAGVVVVSIAVALYTLLLEYVGPPAAAAIIAAGFAVVLAVAGLILVNVGKPKPKREPSRDAGLAGRVLEAVRDRPIIAAGAAAAAGLIAWRNPQLVSVVLRAFEPKQDRA